MQPALSSRQIALAYHNIYVISTPVTSSVSSQMGNSVDTSKSAKSKALKKFPKAVKKPLFLRRQFDNLEMVHINGTLKTT